MLILDQFLDYAIRNKASDLHLAAGSFPIIRVDGELRSIPNTTLISEDDLSKALNMVMTDKQRDSYKTNLEIDFSIKCITGDRFRVNAFRTIDGPSAVFREISSELKSLKDLGTPDIIVELCKLNKGLILVTGPTGSGKSTTLSAMIEYINQNFRRHIITIEDPIEFVHRDKQCLINQREVGRDTLSFAAALRSSLREDPNVIMVGELRDLETMRLALTAAETGHLVLATLHTASAAQSINRIIDVFPSADKPIIRSMLSSSLKSVISQRLIKKKEGGRIGSYEIMIANSSIRNLIREDEVPQISSIIEISKKQGMISMKDSVMDLFERGIISKESAMDVLETVDLIQ